MATFNLFDIRRIPVKVLAKITSAFVLAASMLCGTASGGMRGAGAPAPGARMPAGTVYAGISPETKKPLYTMPRDAPGTYSWLAGMRYCKDLKAFGHDDWRVPTDGELNVLFNNRAAIGGFDVSGSYPAGWYWSGTQYGLWGAWAQRFSDGYQSTTAYGVLFSSVRCVR
jgi:uncharacterized protein DUF1566